MHQTFVFYYNPESEIETITRKRSNSDEKYFIIGHFVYDQNNKKDLIAGMICFKNGGIVQGYFNENIHIYVRKVCQNGNSFEGKARWLMNNDGTVSYRYDQGVHKYSDGKLHEGKRINKLWNGKLNFKTKSGNREISERLNGERHGPAIIYKFDGKVKMVYFSNGKRIFLL